MGTVVCEGWAAVVCEGRAAVVGMCSRETGDRGQTVPAEYGGAGIRLPGTLPPVVGRVQRGVAGLVDHETRTTLLIALVLSAFGGLLVACGPQVLAGLLTPVGGS